MNEYEVSGTFDINNLSSGSMKKLAGHVEGYKDLLAEVFHIPDEIAEKRGNINEAFKLADELINNLRKGKVEKVFRTSDEMEDEYF